MIKAYYNEECLGTFDTIDEAMKKTSADIRAFHEESRYQRLWVETDYTIVIDYGSWSNFYYIKGGTEEEVNAWIMGARRR